MSTEREKTGVFIGAYAINPMTTSASRSGSPTTSCPATAPARSWACPPTTSATTSSRTKFDLPIRTWWRPPGGELPQDEAFVGAYRGRGAGRLRRVHGHDRRRAIGAITQELDERGQGGSRSPTASATGWSAASATGARRSRSSYCDEHGAQPVPEDQLPVLLPSDVDFAPTGVSPLQSHAQFLNATCPVCGEPARRETDTMDTFVDSSWYFLRYCSPERRRRSRGIRWRSTRWLPVDLYTGGAEHAVMHLLYSRFFVKALRDLACLESTSRRWCCATRARSWAPTTSA